MDNTQLTTWLEAAGRGDERSFRLLAQALGQRMFGLAYRLMNNNTHAAEDVVQEVLIKLWKQAPNWQSGGSVAAYASRLVYTTSMDTHRRSKPEESLADENGIEREIPASGRLEARVEQQDTHTQLMHGINQLPERQRQVVLLSYFQDHKQKEIAKVMGTSEKAVESLLVRARKSLAHTLPDELKQCASL